MAKKPNKPKDLAERVQDLETAKDDELTERELRFVEAYVRLGIKSKAIVEAGYSEKGPQVQAARLLSRPRIQQAIVHERAEIARRNHLSEDMVVEGLMLEATTAAAPNARVRAWELLGKRLGLFTDKVEVSGTLTEEQRRSKILGILQAGMSRITGRRSPDDTPEGGTS